MQGGATEQTQDQINPNNQIDAWLLLRAIELVTRISQYQKTALENKFFLATIKPLKDRAWELHHASHWPLNDEIGAIGVEQDYQGIILVNHEQKLALLVHRGLQLDSLKNLVSGLTIGNQEIPPIVEPALQFCELAHQFAEENELTLFHTGFSLGGFLAQVTGLIAIINHNDIIKLSALMHLALKR